METQLRGRLFKVTQRKKTRVSRSKSDGAKPHSCRSKNPESPECDEYANVPQTKHERPANDAVCHYCQKKKKKVTTRVCALLIKQSLVSGRKKERKKTQSWVFFFTLWHLMLIHGLLKQTKQQQSAQNIPSKSWHWVFSENTIPR